MRVPAGLLHCIAFRPESYNDQVANLIGEGLASCIRRLFNLGVVCRDPRLSPLVYRAKVGGVVDDFRGSGFQCREGYEVDG